MNDPTTAIQVIDQLHTLLADLAPRVDPSPARTDSEGVTRLTMAEWGFRDVLDLCVDEIAHWGASSIQVPRRLDLMLEQLSATASPKHREALEEKRFQVAQRPGRPSLPRSLLAPRRHREPSWQQGQARALRRPILAHRQRPWLSPSR
ncbi:DUF2254 domain-containing protein [Ornithinimicrobium sp. INDO-MA30-4]|nr:DUF2254 family protein [Ornithinimicrobium sp. INDO-MA30-4]UJH71089.1 DUF2254 domain-containing protein [Ornithinimicrobium sp. INDO-MA30-4]